MISYVLRSYSLTPGQMHVVLGDDSCVGPFFDLVNWLTIDEFCLLFHNSNSIS